MKGSKFKIRITIWFSAALFIMCLLMGAVIVSLYRLKMENSVLDNLQVVIDECAKMIDGEPELQQILRESEIATADNSGFLQDDVFLMIYREDKSRACGLFLYEELDSLPFDDRQLQKIEIDHAGFWLYDRYIDAEEGGLWIRGLQYSAAEMGDILYTLRDVFLVFPFVLILALLGGYWLAGRFLRPVALISRTAEEIRQNGDLAKRIEIKDTGDEISALARTFNAMFHRLEKNFEAERKFASNASHELRTPVSVILAQCEYALSDTDDTEELKEALEVVQRQGYRMSQLIETLLILTRIEQDTGYYPLEKVNVSELTEDVCRDRRLSAERGITMETEIKTGVTAEINPQLFRLMLDNLLQNAYRYGRENGWIKVILSEKESGIVLKVADNGMGIGEKDLPHIWERFYRADNSRRKKGMGLGLSLVQQIVQYHQGRITVSSTAGEGTEFRIIFEKVRDEK